MEGTVLEYVVGGILLLVAFVLVSIAVNFVIVFTARPWSREWRTALRISNEELVCQFWRIPLEHWREWRCRRARCYLAKHDQFITKSHDDRRVR